MAGAGYKSWVDGDILTAADVNTYLMQQAVMVFADAAARTSAIAAPSEGMVTYLTGTDVIEYYDGTAWQPMLDQDVIQAKGDLIVGTADDTVDRLAVGTDGYVLSADSGETTGLKWVPAGTGKIVQVVAATTSTATTNSSISVWADSALTVTITPTLATSKVLILVSQEVFQSSTLFVAGGHRLLRGASVIYETAGTNNRRSISTYDAGNTATQMAGTLPMAYLDSPATTSATTYKTQILPNSGTMTAQYDSSTSSIIALEVGV
jgi:hypothetical protein